MSFTCLLPDTCTVRRNAPGDAGAYGTPTASWGDHLVDEPCRIYGFTANFAAGKEILVGAEVVVADKLMMIGVVDITEQDRVLSDSVTYEVLMVTLRKDGVGDHHKQCWLKTVR